MVFKQVGDGRPYPDHARTGREWAEIPPRPVRLDQLITTKNVLDLNGVLATDSTFYGDLFPHVVRWHGELYLEDGLHRALRAALQQRSVLHVRVLDLDDGAAAGRADAARVLTYAAPAGSSAGSPNRANTSAPAWNPVTALILSPASVSTSMTAGTKTPAAGSMR